MKKTAFILAVVLTGITSCTSDRDEPAPQANLLLGTWHPDSNKIISGTDASYLGEMPMTACYKQTSYLFKADQTVYNKEYSDETGTCTFMEETMPYSYDPVNQLLMIDGEITPVLQLTDTLLQIQMNDTSFDYNNDGTPDYLVITLKK